MTEQKRLLKAAKKALRWVKDYGTVASDKVAVELEAAIKAEEQMIDEIAVQKAHDDGFKSGLNWPDAWMTHGKPGGPWVPSSGFSFCRNPDKARETYNQLYAENKAWRDAWEKGLAEKIATGRINPLTGTDRNVVFHTQEN